jgi:hypothetical protein
VWCIFLLWLVSVELFGCIGLNPVKVTVPTSLKGRYRSRKADIVTNVLGVCAPDMQFIYVLPGWEGLTHDGRVLRDALSRPIVFRVPIRHGYGYVYRYPADTDTAIRHFMKKPDTWIRFII